jgi:hypothetical protein
MTFPKTLLFGLAILSLPAGSGAAEPPVAAKPETATAAVVSAATGATVSELVVVAAKPPTVSELVVIAPRKPTMVSEVDVVGKIKCVAPEIDRRAHPPRVVSTYPAADAVVAPGLLIIRVTFDQPMSCAGYFAAADPAHNPCDESGAQQRFLMSFDRRTVRTPCLVLPNTRYRLWMNEPRADLSAGPSAPQFVGMNGWRMDGHRLSFTTSAQPPVETVREALGQDPETKLAPGGD